MGLDLQLTNIQNEGVAKTRNGKRNGKWNGTENLCNVIYFIYVLIVKQTKFNKLCVIFKQIINMISFILKMYDFLKINSKINSFFN